MIIFSLKAGMIGDKHLKLIDEDVICLDVAESQMDGNFWVGNDVGGWMIWRKCVQFLEELDVFVNVVEKVLGSVILPPSHVPERNPRTPYVVRTYLSFVSDWFPPRFWTYLPHTVHHLISPSSLPFTC